MSDTLWGLGCAHYGEDSQDIALLRKYIQWARKTKADIAVMGDAFDVGLCFGTKHIGSIWNNHLSPQEQIDAFVDDFRSIKNQIIAVVTGNHEKRADALTDINPLRVMADTLGVPYYGASKVLTWNQKKIFLAHGSTSGADTDFNKVLNTYEGLDAVLLAHTHQLSTKQVRRFVIRDGRTTEKLITLARVGSFLKDAAYAKFALHPPTPIGSAILRCTPTGDLKVQLGI